MADNTPNSDKNNEYKSSPSCFPTGSTVPFPFDAPYPQQVALMDALLQTLHSIRRRNNNSIGNDISTTTTATATKQRTCPVLMLESPTGTGKSLSLACAAVAWLRHVEQEDLQSEPQEQQQPDQQTPATDMNNNKSSASTGLDWLDNWTPPAQRDAEQQQAQMRQQAATARAQLALALQNIHENNNTSNKQDDDDSDNNNNNKQHMKHQRQKQRRANAVRLAVAAQKKQEHSSKQRPHHKRPPFPKKQTHDDYCLEDYRSDTAAADEDSDFEDYSQNKTTAAIAASERDPPVRASQLLSGSALDGSLSSSVCTRRTNTCLSAAASTSTATPAIWTVGQVQPGSGVRKIVYAARTHSQLSQFVSELRRCGAKNKTHNDDKKDCDWPLRVVALGGRKALCGNRSVNTQTTTEAALTETCLDWQKGIKTTVATTAQEDVPNQRKKRKQQTTTRGGCPLLASRAAVDTLALHTLAQPTDIEEASQLGESAQTCAYYATRSALPAAEVVVLPYSMLLSAQTRAAVGLSLQQALVIVDEAHNLPEALRSLHAGRLSLPVVQAALDQLSNYVQKYGQRLAGRNIQYLGQIRKILLAFEKHLKRGGGNSNDDPSNNGSSSSSSSKMKTPGELLIELKLDNINLFKVLSYLEKSRLAQKLLGFITQKKEAAVGKENEASSTAHTADTRAAQQHQAAYAHGELSKHVSAMSVVQSFLEKLVHSDHEGKVVTDWPTTAAGGVETSSRAAANNSSVRHATLRYVLLQPAAFFDNVLQEAHALCLVGGTLRPFVHVAAELLGQDELIEQASQADQVMQPSSGSGGMQRQQVSKCYSRPSFTAFTCDHVVPSSHVLLQCWSKGANGRVLDFRHQSRSSHAVMDELGDSIVEICQQVPNGVVVFVPSYSYEAQLVQRWKRTGTWERMQKTKCGRKLHREPKQSQQIEASLQRYAQDAVQPTGALLFSVVGGKMSEGINFSNEMARCVVVVGLPYPSIADPEIQEKMALMDNHHASSGSGGCTARSAVSGQAYYQNLCLRAINQSVGRAIRHAKDYAAIVLLDRRYNTDARIRAGLPEWLKRGETTGRGTSEGAEMNHRERLAQLECFFAKHQST